MRIQLVSYNFGENSSIDRFNICSEILKTSDADILFFPGHSLWEGKDIRRLFEENKGKIIPSVFIEAAGLGFPDKDWIENIGYVIHDNFLKTKYSPQFFSTSDDVNNNEELVEAFINELEKNRIWDINHLKIMELRCGEQNILKNLQGSNNKVSFRIEERKDLKKRFEKLLKSIDIIYNPTHSPMGNQGKLHLRRVFFSKNKRIYVSTTSVEARLNLDQFRARKLQYVFKNGKEIEYKKMTSNKFYLIREYEIDN